MGFLRKLFGLSSRRDADLLTSLLKLQADRITADAEVEKLDRELKLKTRQLEIENIERIAEEKRKDLAEKQRLAERRREWFAQARAKKAEKAAQRAAAPAQNSGMQGCVVCANPSSPHLTAHEITWHAAGHPGAMNNAVH